MAIQHIKLENEGWERDQTVDRADRAELQRPEQLTGMRAVSTAALMAAWEEGMGEPAVDRAPALLRSLRLGQAGCDPADMTVGTCDLLLFDLRRFLFGPDLDLVATCPACGELIEVAIPASAVVPARPAVPVSHVTVESDGMSIRCRVPTNADLRALAAIGSGAEVADLLDRCVEEIEGPHVPDTAAALPPPVAERVAGALAASDPGADVSVDLACPCGAQLARDHRHPLDPVGRADHVGSAAAGRGAPARLRVRLGRTGHPRDEPVPAPLLPRIVPRMTAYLNRVRQLSEGQPSLRVRARSRFEPVPPDAEPPWERAAAAILPPSPGAAAEVPGARRPAGAGPAGGRACPPAAGFRGSGRASRGGSGTGPAVAGLSRRAVTGPAGRPGRTRAPAAPGRGSRTPADDATAGGGHPAEPGQPRAGPAGPGRAMRPGARAPTRPARLSRPGVASRRRRRRIGPRPRGRPEARTRRHA